MQELPWDYDPEYNIHRDPLGSYVEEVLQVLRSLDVRANDGDVAQLVWADDRYEGLPVARQVEEWAADAALRYCAERGIALLNEVG